LPGVRPLIEAAWIAAGSGLLGGVVGVTSAVIVARIGFRATRETAAATIAANSTDIQAQLETESQNIRAQIEATSVDLRTQLDVDRRNRLWEKQAEAYVEALAVIARRQAERGHLTSLLSYDEATEAKRRKMYADPEDWDWATASAKLTAFASQPVLDATRAVEAEHLSAKFKVEEFTALRERADRPGLGRPDDQDVPAAWREVEAKLAAAKAGGTGPDEARLIRARVQLCIRRAANRVFVVIREGAASWAHTAG
jgi:hypothetical protein